MNDQIEDIVENRDSEGWLDRILLLTLVLLLFMQYAAWFIELPIAVLVVLGVSVKSMRFSQLFWLFLFAIQIGNCYVHWYLEDNHKFLTAYWCLSIALSVESVAARRILASNARLLVGLSFLFAVIWKLSNGDFVDSRFFQFELLVDYRFNDVAKWIGGMSTEDLSRNYSMMERLFTEAHSEPVNLIRPSRLVAAARVMTIWTLMIEGLVCISFLVEVSQ